MSDLLGLLPFTLRTQRRWVWCEFRPIVEVQSLLNTSTVAHDDTASGIFFNYSNLYVIKMISSSMHIDCLAASILSTLSMNAAGGKGSYVTIISDNGDAQRQETRDTRRGCEAGHCPVLPLSDTKDWSSHFGVSLRWQWLGSLSLLGPLWSDFEASTRMWEVHKQVPNTVTAMVSYTILLWLYLLSPFFSIRKMAGHFQIHGSNEKPVLFYCSHFASWINMKYNLKQLFKDSHIFNIFTNLGKIASYVGKFTVISLNCP